MVAIVGFRIGFVSLRAYVGDYCRGDRLVPSGPKVAMAALCCGRMGGGEPHLAGLSLSQRCRIGNGRGFCGRIDLQWALALVGTVLCPGDCGDRPDDVVADRAIVGADTSDP